VLDPLEVVIGEDWLGFGGVKPPSVPIISATQQFAEKFHAYTLPREGRTNTRTKDLVDMVLLVREQVLDRPKTAAAIRATFARRLTHKVPERLVSPPLAMGIGVRCPRERMPFGLETSRSIQAGQGIRGNARSLGTGEEK
jgi:hypothetical protein